MWAHHSKYHIKFSNKSSFHSNIFSASNVSLISYRGTITLLLLSRAEELAIFAFLNLYVNLHEIYGNFRKLNFVSLPFSCKLSSFWISICLKKYYFQKNSYLSAIISILWRISLQIPGTPIDTLVKFPIRSFIPDKWKIPNWQ